jgi:hypothetical protein
MIHLRQNNIVQDAENAITANSIPSAEDVLLLHTASDAIFLKKKTLSVSLAINLQKHFLLRAEPIICLEKNIGKC